VTRNTVKDEHIVCRKANPVKIQGYDLFREGEVLVFEQEAELKNTVNEVELLFRIGSRPVPAGNSISQFRPEIKVMTPASEHALPSNDITERTLADAGGAEKED
jgi:accessory colonization factor AcfC